MTTTPSAELRAAAEKLRDLAAAAAADSGSPHWHAHRHFPSQPDATFTSLLTDSNAPLMRGGGKNRAPYVNAPVGDYIAAMDPAVGQALADWLGCLAVLDPSERGGAECGWCGSNHALAVARALTA